MSDDDFFQEVSVDGDDGGNLLESLGEVNPVENVGENVLNFSQEEAEGGGSAEPVVDLFAQQPEIVQDEEDTNFFGEMEVTEPGVEAVQQEAEPVVFEEPKEEEPSFFSMWRSKKMKELEAKSDENRSQQQKFRDESEKFKAKFLEERKSRTKLLFEENLKKEELFRETQVEKDPDNEWKNVWYFLEEEVVVKRKRQKKKKEAEGTEKVKVVIERKDVTRMRKLIRELKNK